MTVATVLEPRPGCGADRHDTVDAYSNHGCRCPRARSLKTREWQKYLLRRLRGQSLFTDSTGTVRRLQALHALGWRNSDLAARLGGVDRTAVQKLQDRPVVHVNTAAAVRRLYDELADHRGPSRVTARRAAARGWLVPLWWDDDQIDDPAYDPRRDVIPDEMSPARESRTARIDEVHRLTALGLTAAQIAEQVGVTRRQVERDRKQPPTTPAAPAPACTSDVRSSA